MYKRPLNRYLRIAGRIFSRGLALCAAWVMVQTGAWFWVDGFRALRPDHDPATALHLEQVYDENTGGYDDSVEAGLEGGVIPIEGGFIIYGNGDLDDNREKPFVLKRWAGVTVPPRATPAAVSSFGERRTTAGYKDFGHLKVMPAAGGSDFNNCSRSSFERKAACLGTGGLYYCPDFVKSGQSRDSESESILLTDCRRNTRVRASQR